MEHSLETGLSFGLTTGVTTTLGLIVGLAAGTQSEATVLGGILIIAVADALSESLGIHISEEAEGIHNHRQVWLSTAYLFITKFLVVSSFIVPVLVFELTTAVFVSVVWGISLIVLLNLFVVGNEHDDRMRPVLEHLMIVLLVVFVTYYIGTMASRIFV